MKEKDDKYAGKLELLNIDYFKYKTLLTKKFKNRKVYKEKDPRLVTAFIPGTIRNVIVKPGDTVKKGELLLVLDAMKMKNRVLSPMDGTVKQVNIKSGAIVSKDHVLVELNEV